MSDQTPETPLCDNQQDQDHSSSSLETVDEVDKLYRQLHEGLNLDSSEDDAEVKKKQTIVDLDGIVNYIKEHDCKNIITMAGAGISTSAGIPDFRSRGSGLYTKLQKYNLPKPEAIFDINFFENDPIPFFKFTKEILPAAHTPTISHFFIKLLNEKNVLLRHFTQNVDTLERVAGIPEEKLIEAHGSFNTGHCRQCQKEYSLTWMKIHILKDKVPICELEGCEGVVKPDIVFFGESLPENFHRGVKEDFPKCDLLIIMGSSLVVMPFAFLVNAVPDTCPRLLINRETVDQDLFREKDVFFKGNCDEGCQSLADKLGWGEELKQMRKTFLEKMGKTEKIKAKT